MAEGLASGVLQVGTLISQRYRVRRVIGEGGMATVYEVDDLRTMGRRALKLLHSELIDSEPELVRFKREARIAERIDDEHVVRVSDVDVYADRPFIVMELLHGQDLKQIIGDRGRITPLRAAEIARQCCNALERAHRQGIVHRDIKPANIFVQQVDGRDFVKLLDFGISKVDRRMRQQMALEGPSTQLGVWLGSPHYMSPEQVRADGAIDHRTDIYSLGVVLFEAVTGQLPYEGDNVFELFRSIGEGRAQRLSPSKPLPPRLDAIVEVALAKDPRQRFADVAEMGRALDRFAEHDRGTKRSLGIRTAAWPIAAALASAAAVWTWQSWPTIENTSARSTTHEDEHEDQDEHEHEDQDEHEHGRERARERDRGTARETDRGQRFVTERGRVLMVLVPGGSAVIGSPPSEEGRVAEREAQREIVLPAFYLGKYEITNAQYARFLATHPELPAPAFWHDDTTAPPDEPVVGITRDEAARFAAWAAGRLPTEAEWEYACRAGSRQARYGKLPEIAVYGRGARSGASRVGTKRANAFGLHDMLGNVLELTQSERYSRGGSWGSTARYLRAAARNLRGKRARNKYTGFRIAADP